MIRSALPARARSFPGEVFPSERSLPTSYSADASRRDVSQPHKHPSNGRFWLAEVLGVIMGVLVFQAIFGDMLNEHAIKPLRQLAEARALHVRPRLPSSPAVRKYAVYFLEKKVANANIRDTEGRKGFLCLKLPSKMPSIQHIAPDPQAANETLPDLGSPSPILAGVDFDLDNSAVAAEDLATVHEDAAGPICGGTTKDTTVVFIMYHKMGTVWWQHVLRVLSFAMGDFVFEVNSGDEDSMKVLQVIAEQAIDAPRRFPAFIFMDNPSLETMQQLRRLTLQSGRSMKILLQVRDFRDVLVSGLHFHKTHTASDVTSEDWLHKPEVWWGEALGRPHDAVSYQYALNHLPPVDGAALEMDMVEDIWASIARIAHDEQLAALSAFVTYEAMWSSAGNLLPKIASFLYGDMRCNPSAMRLVRAALSYTAGFRKVTMSAAVAAATAASPGGAFDAAKVDIREMVDVLKGKGTRTESDGSEEELRRFFVRTFANAGAHFNRGSPHGWRSSAAFTPEVGRLFSARYQCLLRFFRYETDDSWLPTITAATATSVRT